MSKVNRYPNWINTISEEICYGGPRKFSKSVLLNQECLFAHRAALFYTPTENIPNKYVGVGRIDIQLPLVTPDYTEVKELKSYMTPRFWVDLIQRQTFKLRWKPFEKALVKFTKYDYFQIRNDHFIIGAKALLDALKIRTAGRRDGRTLYYFGAIIDDSQKYVRVDWHQKFTNHPKDASIRVQVMPISE